MLTQRYGSESLDFCQADVTRLPLGDGEVDVVVSFETLEHLEAQDAMLAEFRRVLRPDGFMLISSPDRKTYSDDTGYSNPFHVRELYRDEFESLLARHFPARRLFGQKLMFVSALWQLDQGGSAVWHTADSTGINHTPQPVLPPLYFLAAAAAGPDALPRRSRRFRFMVIVMKPSISTTTTRFASISGPENCSPNGMPKLPSCGLAWSTGR